MDTAFKNSNNNICTLGLLIHNKYVTDRLADVGVQSINNIKEANGRKVLVRAHGVAKQIYSQMKNLGIDYIDCTCPFVKKIHKLVEENYNSGRKIIIIGDSKHPEVVGINGFADDSAFVLKNLSEAENFFVDRNLLYTLVLQTTFDVDEFRKIVLVFEKYKNIKIFDTICNTTKKRQSEAEYLSKISDKMIVIGDPQSSNTTKLFALCHKNCCNTFFIHNPSELDLNNFRNDDKIGIVAGASTPLHVIREAISFMTPSDEKSFEQLLDESFVTLRRGQVVHGTVVQVSDNEVVLDLGYKSDGIITKENYSDYLGSLKDIANIGDEIDAIVYRVDDENGNIFLSKKRVDLRNGFKIIEKAFETGEIITGKVVNVVKGGVTILSNNVRLFVPATHLFNSDVHNLDLKSYVGQTLDFNIIEFNPAKHRFIASRKKIEQDKKCEGSDRSFSDIAVGEWIKGTIKKILDFGLLVDLGGCTGLVHKSQIDWSISDDFEDKRDEFSVGDKVDVCAIKKDEEAKKIFLTMRKPEDSPWCTAGQRYPVGAVVTGKVARLSTYGAFVELEPFIDGLLHISQISKERVKNIKEKLHVGDIVKAKVISIEQDKKRLALSMVDLDQ